MKLGNRNLKRAFIVLIGLFFLIVSFSIYQFLRFDVQYSKVQMEYTERLEEQIMEILQNDDREKALNELVSKYPLDIVIYDDKETIFANTNFTKDTPILNTKNPLAYIYEAEGIFETRDETLMVWVGMYKMDDTYFMQAYLSKHLFSIFIIIAVICLFLFYMQRYLYVPLIQVDKSITKAMDYDFDSVSYGDDRLNRRMKTLVDQIHTERDAVSIQSTELEVSLIDSERRLNSLITLSKALIHDLKNPVRVSIIDNENYDESDITRVNIENLNRIMEEINRILHFLNKASTTGELLDIDAFDLVSQVSKSLNTMHREAVSKNIGIELVSDQELMIEEDQSMVALMLQNLISNALIYSNEGSIITVELLEENNQARFRISNQSNQEDIDNMIKSERNILKNTNKHSSGYGLSLVKNICHIINANYDLKIHDEDVTIEITFKESL